jgi:hypothetical protein
MNKLQIQDHFFSLLIGRNIMPIQSRFIAYKLIENYNILSFNFLILQSDYIIIETATQEKYKIELLSVDIPSNSIIKI